LFVNTPSNPTGAVFGSDTMVGLVEIADRHDLWLLSDEVYDELVLADDAVHVPAARFDTEGRVITVFSFSKVYAMTGWRVGYVVAPDAIAALLRTLQEPQVSCPSTISQKAAEAALTGPRQPIDAMREAYRVRLDAALGAINRHSLDAVAPRGTIYMLIGIGGRESLPFALGLLERKSVSVAPGMVFGPAGEGRIRISLAADSATIVDGISRMAAELTERAGTTT
jgi:aspartate/methionine/tyrosine aminotransferase